MDYIYSLVTQTGIHILLGLSVYTVALTGQVSFGQQGFYAIGAYISAMATTLWGVPLLPALLLGMVISSFVGVLVGNCRQGVCEAFRPECLVCSNHVGDQEDRTALGNTGLLGVFPRCVLAGPACGILRQTAGLRPHRRHQRWRVASDPRLLRAATDPEHLSSDRLPGHLRQRLVHPLLLQGPLPGGGGGRTLSPSG